ncbi:hypothetical protein MNBD_NITROSPINAE02-2095 [hydrothermal vent metagenome]|uniref:Flagellin protein FlaA n=1 Tax=hydrothermal vent metagenome TaxID=652676 RepID=A0A3B1CFK4_9ZZZZ
MAISLNTFFAASARRNIGIANNNLSENFAKLSSGRRITKAAVDAAGLAIAEQLQADIRSSQQAQRNLTDGAALTRVAEGGLSEISNLLTRGRELSIQAANGTLNDSQRATIQIEIDSIKSEITRISDTTEFNGQKVINGELSSGAPEVTVQAGIQNTSSDRISLNVLEDSGSTALGIGSVDVSTRQGAQDALTSFDSALASVASNRASVGALQNRFDRAASNLAVSRENLQAANAAIRDLDYAAETSSLSNNQILQKAAVKTLSSGLESQRGLIGALLNIRG